jgi:hypothetical protein
VFVVKYDIFPAKVIVSPPQKKDKDNKDTFSYDDLHYYSDLTGARRVEAVRIVITEKTVLIAADAQAGPMLIFKEKYDSDSLFVQKNKSKPSRLRTESGKILVFQKDDNCGCGSRLRTWNPYRTVYSTKDPIE